MDYVLFAARHEMPTTEGALCADFDFAAKKVVRAAAWQQAILDPYCRVYVTGLTPALTEFMAAYQAARALYPLPTLGQAHFLAEGDEGYANTPAPGAGLTLLHYDRDSGKYWPQLV